MTGFSIKNEDKTLFSNEENDQPQGQTNEGLKEARPANKRGENHGSNQEGTYILADHSLMIDN